MLLELYRKRPRWRRSSFKTQAVQSKITNMTTIEPASDHSADKLGRPLSEHDHPKEESNCLRLENLCGVKNRCLGMMQTLKKKNIPLVSWQNTSINKCPKLRWHLGHTLPALAIESVPGPVCFSLLFKMKSVMQTFDIFTWRRHTSFRLRIFHRRWTVVPSCTIRQREHELNMQARNAHLSPGAVPLG